MSQPATQGASGSRSHRWEIVVLAALLIVGLGLRVWYLPAASRLGGEGAGITNIEVALAEGETRKLAALPLAWYPQSLALDLVDRLSDEQTKSRFKVITKKGKVTRRGLHVARVFSLLYGLAGVALLYSIGRRLGSVFIGVAAAVILCFSPWHIQGSVIFTPEILVLALSLLALWLGLQALDDPSSLRFAGVGVALGLAAAADLDGVLVALPVLAALAAAGGRRFGRVLLPLAVAVPVAVLVWWLLTPPLGAYLEALELERASNARRAAEDSSSRFTVIVLGFLYPLLDSVHGRLLGALALLGALGQAIRLLFLVDAGPDRVQRLMVLAAAPVFVLGHAWNTPLYSEVAFVPLVAFSSLYAAVLLESVGRGLASWVPRLGGTRGLLAVAVLGAVLVVPDGWRFVHSKAVTSTLEIAMDRLRPGLREGGPRVVLVEQAAFAQRATGFAEIAPGAALHVVSRLADLEEARLMRADAEVFLQAELEGVDAAFYKERSQIGGRRRQISGDSLWRHGPGLVTVLHPYGGGVTERIPLTVTPMKQSRVADLPPELATGQLFSIVLEIPPLAVSTTTAPWVMLGETTIPMASAGRVGGRPLFVSERLTVETPPGALAIGLPPGVSPEAEVAATLVLWGEPSHQVATTEP